MVICYSLGELQKPLPVLTLPELGSCSLLRSFMSSELNSLVELTTEKGYSYSTFLELFLVVFSPILHVCLSFPDSHMRALTKWNLCFSLWPVWHNCLTIILSSLTCPCSGNFSWRTISKWLALKIGQHP